MLKHKHHIIPKYMGGTDDPSNLVELTVEEHAEAHRVLYEQYGNWQDRIAWLSLSGQIGKDEAIQEARGAANRGRKRSPEQIVRMKASAAKRVERWRQDGTLERANQKRSQTQKGYKKTEEHMANWIAARKENFAKKKGLV